MTSIETVKAVGETADVLAAIRRLRAQNQPMALATIVDIKGSTYRRPGARLLVPADGRSVGNLSGGCLEGEVEGVARSVMQEGGSQTVLYDLTADDEVIWGWGLGCNGAIEVFIEPADKAAEVADALALALDEERSIAVVTVLESTADGVAVGDRLLVHPGGGREGSLGLSGADDVVARAAGDALERGATQMLELDLEPGSAGSKDGTDPGSAGSKDKDGLGLGSAGSKDKDGLGLGSAGSKDGTEPGRARVFIEVLEPPPRLLVCGAGHDAIPLVGAGAALGWRVVVVDDRDAFLDSERFPGAAGFVAAQPAEVASGAGVDARTYAVVMSHNYLRDRDYLRSLLGTKIAYIGMLGPRARLERLLDDLAGDGVIPSEQDRAKLHGPAGLDIGGEGPDEVAAAVVAEVLAVSRSREAGFLRDRAGPIHERRLALQSTKVG